ncbi:MAG: M23 family metallopeptidase [Leptolyngbyaceae cyanobacterium bins.59]|nr:M23 family metallopeptidase [Leptolyngbyaceae cyanobacterium bins.59]
MMQLQLANLGNLAIGLGALSTVVLQPLHAFAAARSVNPQDSLSSSLALEAGAQGVIDEENVPTWVPTTLPLQGSKTKNSQDKNANKVFAPRLPFATRPDNQEIYEIIPERQEVTPEMSIPITPGQPLPSTRPNASSQYVWPAKGVLTSGFGWRWGRMHQGIDIAGPVGTPISAAAGGTVTYAKWDDGGYGNLVEIKHGDGSITRYAHNSRILVRTGQEVEQRQPIALMGSTGRSTGPHSHFEIRLPGKGAVNPIALLKR